jgi:hypothetical protein
LIARVKFTASEGRVFIRRITVARVNAAGLNAPSEQEPVAGAEFNEK